MAGSLASINVVFRVDLKELSSELQNAVRDIKKYGDAMQDIGKNMSLYLTAPVLAAGGASIKMASDFEESQNKVDVAFKKSAGEIQAFAKTSLTNFGIAEGSALDMAALFGDMATSMGLPDAEAAKMSKTLVGLAGDLASFKNIGIDQATTALNGVFTGETESLKMLGIVMTEANLQQFALEQGMKKSIKNFTQAEKVQLRYAYVMQQTTNAQGDFLRTGGGAANQVRVMQEGLKELAVQFGQVILPAFTAVIKRINEFINGIKNLDPELRSTIVLVAGAAAAIGPLLFGLGAAAKAYANFAQMAYTATAALAANPMTAAAVAIGAIASYALIATSRFTPLTNAVSEFNKVMQGATDSISKESAELNKNLSVAKNDIYSKEQREQAVKNLNALSPEYLGNLTLENINTVAATKATESYVSALKQKAKIMAAEEKLVDVEKKLLDLQLANLDAVKPSVWQNLGNAFMAAGDGATFAVLSTKTLARNLYQETGELTKLQEQLINFISENENFEQSQTDVALATDVLNKSLAGEGVSLMDSLNKLIDTNKNFVASQKNVAKEIGETPKAATIDYYRGLISSLQKLQNETATSNSTFSSLQQKIDKYQEKINKIEGKSVKVETVIPSNEKLKAPSLKISDDKSRINFYQTEIDKFKELQKAYTDGSAEFKRIQALIDGLDFTIKLNNDPSKSITATLLTINSAIDESTVKMLAMQPVLEGVANGFATAFEGMAGRFVDSLGLANDGMEGFFKGIAQTVIQLISAMLAQSLAQSIAGATAAGTATGPAAVVTTPAFIATAIAGVLGAFAAIPKFESGGIVGGTSYSGDKLFARINSGEMILNKGQQNNLSNMLQPAGSNVNIMLDGAFKINGNDLELILNRVAKRNNRIK